MSLNPLNSSLSTSAFGSSSANSSAGHSIGLLADSSTSTSKVVEVVPKHPAFVLGEQLHRLCTFVYSNLPTFSFPGAFAVPTEAHSCPDGLSLDNSEAKVHCLIPDGSYQESCHPPKVKPLPDGNCQATTRCETILAGLPHQLNVVTYRPGELPDLENKNGTLVDLSRISPEDANKALAKSSDSLKEIDGKLEQRDLEKSERKALEREKAAILKKQSEIVGRLSPGDIITFNKGTDQLIVITPENHGGDEHLYDSEAMSKFRELASATGGIMGLSPSAELLPKVIENTFQHILNSADSNEPLDVAFVLDTTSSMTNDIDAVKENLVGFLEKLKSKKGESVRVSLIEYLDKGDRFLNRIDSDFTTDFEALANKLNDIEVRGGGDSPEAVLDALILAKGKLSWREDAKHKIILIGDAPPHPKTVDGIDGNAVIESYRRADIQIAVYPIVTNMKW